MHRTIHNARSTWTRIRLVGAVAGITAALGLATGGSAQAAESVKRLAPVASTPRTLSFKPPAVDPDSIVGAHASMTLGKRKRKLGDLERGVNLDRVREAVRLDKPFRMRKARRIHSGALYLSIDKSDPPSRPAGDCAFDGGALSESSCQTLFEDTGAGNPASVWGSVDCETASRVASPAGGDPELTAGGTPQASDAFRRMTVFDGDDFWGERCELGLNDNRRSPTALYHEGEHRITFFSVRLPDNYPLSTNSWQTVMQMKQAQPAANGSGAPILEMNARGGSWMLVNDWNNVWQVPAQKGVWTRFAFDVHYSQDPSVGTLKAYVDLNGDGDALDPQEQSPTLHIATLRREIEGGSPTDGIAPGESIPSHLRMGVYHDPGIACASGCSVDVDNVQVVDAP